MKFLIHNLTNETKSICRFGGKKVIILPNDYIEFEPNNDIESSYWATISRTNNVSGLDVIVDETRQAIIRKLKRCGKLASINNTVNTNTNTNVSDVDNTITSLNIDDSNVLDTTIEETVNEPINNEPLQEIENVNEIISDEQVFDTEVEEVITDESITEDTTENETIETDVVDINDNDTVEDTIETVVETAEETITEPTTDEATITEDVETVESDVESDDIDETNNFVKYSEEELNNMTKEHLQGILDELGVSYRKNNTNATLINLILGYYNSEE